MGGGLEWSPPWRTPTINLIDSLLKSFKDVRAKGTKPVRLTAIFDVRTGLHSYTSAIVQIALRRFDGLAGIESSMELASLLHLEGVAIVQQLRVLGLTLLG